MRIQDVPTPCYVVDEAKLIRNLELLKKVQEEAGCRILLAQKAFSMFYEYPLIGQYLAGTTASGLYEARLGREEMGKENHVFSPGYREQEMDEIVSVCDHVIFNSFSQLKKYRDRCLGRTSIGLRINPECSTQGDHAIYDPCAPGSRLGVTLENFKKALLEDPDALEGVEGLHFHTLCEQNSDDLETTARAFEEKFGKYLHGLKWVNFGGGHHITRPDYDIERLVRTIEHFRDTYGVQVYLEPGEAVVYHAGFLIASVLETLHNGMDIAILDTSAACHMPDVLEMPYRPPLWQSGEPGEKAHTYRLGGPTCLAGDIIGDYSFDQPLQEGDRLVFEDMALYTMVKTNTFNGMPLPAILWRDEQGQGWLVKEFGYEDFKNRLS